MRGDDTEQILNNSGHTQYKLNFTDVNYKDYLVH